MDGGAWLGSFLKRAGATAVFALTCSYAAAAGVVVTSSPVLSPLVSGHLRSQVPARSHETAHDVEGPQEEEKQAG